MAGNALGTVIGGIVLGAVIGVGGTLAVVKGKGFQNGAKQAGSSDQTCSIDGASSKNQALFTVDGKTYSSADLPSESQDVFFQVESQAYRSRRDFLEDVALRVALAAEKSPNVDMASLPPLNQLLTTAEPSEQEMKEFFDKNQKNLPPGATYEQIKPQLKQFLGNRALSAEVGKKVTELETAGRLVFQFKEPVAPVVELPLADYPTKGNASAAVTLVEVTDYLCPHCRNVKPEVEQVLKEFGDKIKFVQIDFSLRPSGLSGFLVRGAFCASKQSPENYWKYHEKAFAVPLEASESVSPDAQKEFKATAVAVAKDTGLDTAALEACIDSQEAQDHVNKTNQVFSSKGVSGTPTFFLANRKLSLGGKSLKESVALALKNEGTTSN